MPIYVDEERARRELDIGAVVEALRAVFLSQANGDVTNVPRARTPVLGRSLNITAAADASSERFAVKIYGSGDFHILLYSKSEGLLAIMEADWLGRLRTGAATGLATELLAPPRAGRVGIIGAGRQASAQLLALHAVGRLREARVFARDRKKLMDFCTEAEAALQLPIAPADSAAHAVHDAEIVVTATTSSEPVLARGWLAAGVHVNAMGANSAQRQELDLQTVRDAGLLVVDDPVQARKEAAEFIRLESMGAFDWASVVPLSTIVRDGRPRREAGAITVFKSLGAGLEDLAIASLLYDRIRVAGASKAPIV